MVRLVQDDRKATVSQITTCYNQGLQKTHQNWTEIGKTLPGLLSLDFSCDIQHSPDLSTIEHLWDVAEREICIMDVQPANLQQL